MNSPKITLILLLNIFIINNTIAHNIEKPKGTLPVTIVDGSFIGDIIDSTVEIKWETATEQNNYGFYILRSDTSFVWLEIDFVQQLPANSNAPKYYKFIDTTINANGNYFYQLKQMDIDGITSVYQDTVKVTVDYITSILENISQEDFLPENFKLFQNYPNPFNPGTNILFTLRERSFVTLKIYSLTGEEIKTLISGRVTEGTHSIKFKPNSLPSGIYIYKLNVENNSATKKMLLIK